MKAKLTANGETSKLTITFDGFAFTDGHGPFFVGGAFNDWKTDDPKFRILQPPQRGANSLNDFVAELDSDVDFCEFKIWDAGHSSWVEPCLGACPSNMYGGLPASLLILNRFGTFNVRVEK